MKLAKIHLHCILKFAQDTPVFNADNVNELGNYRPTSVLPYFSKLLERIMYNRLLEYLTTNEIRHKQFGFQKRHVNLVLLSSYR